MSGSRVVEWATTSRKFLDILGGQTSVYASPPGRFCESKFRQQGLAQDLGLAETATVADRAEHLFGNVERSASGLGPGPTSFRPGGGGRSISINYNLMRAWNLAFLDLSEEGEDTAGQRGQVMRFVCLFHPGLFYHLRECPLRRMKTKPDRWKV